MIGHKRDVVLEYVYFDGAEQCFNEIIEWINSKIKVSNSKYSAIYKPFDCPGGFIDTYSSSSFETLQGDYIGIIGNLIFAFQEVDLKSE